MSSTSTKSQRGRSSSRQWSLFRPVRKFLARNWRTILICLPALLAGGTALAVGVSAGLVTRDVLVVRYEREALRAARAEQHPRALLCLDRLTQFFPDRAAYRFLMAEQLTASGEPARAENLIATMAPLDQPGYPEAHLWTARRLLEGPVSPRALGDIEAHLQRVLDAQPHNEEALALLGQIYAQTGRPIDAERCLTQVVGQRPELMLVLSQACAAQDKPHTAETWAKTADRIFEQRTRAQPDDALARLRWAEARALLQDHAGAVRILEEGRLRGEDATFRQAIGDMTALWADALTRDQPDDLAARLAVLERGLRAYPAHLGLLGRLQKVLTADPGQADAIRQRLRDLLSGGAAAPSLHLLLGNDAFLRGQTDEARFHWEQAFQLAPEYAFVANNLAWVLADTAREPADLERALELANSALNRQPNQPQFHGTRGHVLARLERWEEALTDLQRALPASPNEPALHRDLADAYEALGRPELAASHRRKAGPAETEAEAEAEAEPKPATPTP
jgi:tetratricopeptide (TPR) repeat protein